LCSSGRKWGDFSFCEKAGKVLSKREKEIQTAAFHTKKRGKRRTTAGRVGVPKSDGRKKTGPLKKESHQEKDLNNNNLL